MSAYDAIYLNDAQETLGSALDYAVHVRNCALDSFWNLFLASALSTQFAKGNPFILAGSSGNELAIRVLEETTSATRTESGTNDAKNASDFQKTKGIQNVQDAHAQRACQERSPEYWTGWALAYYQWHSALPFARIQKDVPIESVLAMYRPYHEMDTSAFVEAMDCRIARAHPCTSLQELRVSMGISQSKLAELSGVSLRTIQHYEQRSKNINRAQIDHLLNLSRALHCSVEQLLEPVDDSRYEYAIMHLPE